MRPHQKNTMKGKTCLVTGANAGLGFETALALANRGAKVLLLCRSEEKGQRAKRIIVEDSENEQVEVVVADLSSQDSVRKASEAILAKHPVIDVLVNNAAAVVSERILSPDGIELQFAVNHLGHFLLTQQLLPALIKSDEGRVVNVSSKNHTMGKIHYEDPNLNKNYHVLRAYGQSKLANVLFTYELDRKLQAAGVKHIAVNCVDPGPNKTDIGSKSTGFFHGLAWKIKASFGNDPSRGAATQILLASSPRVKGITGKYWFKSKEKVSSKRSRNPEEAARLWEMSEKMTGIKQYLPQGLQPVNN